MKLNTTYNLKRGALVGLLALLPFAACKKEPIEPTPDTPTPVTPVQPTQKHNVELVYDDIEQDMPMDTLYKYNADPTVDTIFMIPADVGRFSGASTQGLQNVINNRLRPRHQINPEKIFGKGELMLRGSSVENNPEIVRFFSDTLKYNVILTNYKSR